MSAVELVREWLQEFGYSSEHDALAAGIARYFAEDVEYRPVRGWTEAEPCHGREQLIEFIAKWADAWDNYKFHVVELFDHEDYVIAHMRIEATGRASGMPLAGDVFTVFEVRYGRIVAQRDHLTHAGAMADLPG